MAKITNPNRPQAPYGLLLGRLFRGKGVMAAVSGLVVKLMDKKVPTTSKYITEEQRREVREILQPGDLLLETNNEYPGWQSVEKLLFKSNWTHAAMYMGDGKVAQATSDGEGFDSATPLDKFLDSYHVAVVRPHYKTDGDKAAALQYMRDAEGRMYDSAYNTADESELYCSEGPYHAFRKMPNPIVVEPEHKAGLTIVSPGAFAHHPEFTMIWSSGSKFWRNQATHAPIGVGAVLGAAGLAYLGAQFSHPVLFGVLGAVAGTGLGYGAMRLLWPSLDSRRSSESQGDEVAPNPVAAGQAKAAPADAPQERKRNFMPRPVTISPGGKKTIC